MNSKFVTSCYAFKDSILIVSTSPSWFYSLVWEDMFSKMVVSSLISCSSSNSQG